MCEVNHFLTKHTLWFHKNTKVSCEGGRIYIKIYKKGQEEVHVKDLLGEKTTIKIIVNYKQNANNTMLKRFGYCFLRQMPFLMRLGLDSAALAASATKLLHSNFNI